MQIIIIIIMKNVWFMKWQGIKRDFKTLNVSLWMCVCVLTVKRKSVSNKLLLLLWLLFCAFVLIHHFLLFFFSLLWKSNGIFKSIEHRSIQKKYDFICDLDHHKLLYYYCSYCCSCCCYWILLPDRFTRIKRLKHSFLHLF